MGKCLTCVQRRYLLTHRKAKGLRLVKWILKYILKIIFIEREFPPASSLPKCSQQGWFQVSHRHGRNLLDVPTPREGKLQLSVGKNAKNGGDLHSRAFLPCRGETDMDKGAAREQKDRWGKHRAGVLNPAWHGSWSSVASVLIRWGMLTCVRHWSFSGSAALGACHMSGFLPKFQSDVRVTYWAQSKLCTPLDNHGNHQNPTPCTIATAFQGLHMQNARVTSRDGYRTQAFNWGTMAS